MDFYGLVLISAISGIVSAIAFAIWHVFLLFIQLFGYTFIVTNNTGVIFEVLEIVSISTHYNSGYKSGLVIGKRIVGYISIEDKNEVLRCICPKSMLNGFFDIDSESAKAGYHLRFSYSGLRNNPSIEKKIMRSIPEGKHIRDYQSRILEQAKSGVRAFLICGPQGEANHQLQA
jgi:hypothetical protein